MNTEQDNEINEISKTLTEQQLKDCSQFEFYCESQSGIFGCPQLWTIYKQAWLLENGFKLKHCKYKTAEELLGFTTDIIGKLHDKLDEVKKE